LPPQDAGGPHWNLGLITTLWSVSVIDGLPAATALHYNLTLVTRTSGHSAIIGVDVFNPWQT